MKKELTSILSSHLFVRSDNKKRFLSYIVEKKLAGQPEEEFKEYTIATEAFDTARISIPKKIILFGGRPGRFERNFKNTTTDLERTPQSVSKSPRGRMSQSSSLCPGLNAAGRGFSC